MKGCYVCGKNHKARTRQSPKEVREAIERLKNKNPQAMITVSDLALISSELCENADEDDLISESD